MSHKSYVNIDLLGNKVTGGADGTAASDYITKSQLDAALVGLSWKDAVQVASTTNINLAAPGASHDGYSFVSGDRFLAKDQTTDVERGIYVWNGAAVSATRALDSNAFLGLNGASLTVVNGTANGDKAFTQTADLVAFTGQTWVQFGAGNTYSAGAGLTLTSTTFDVVTGDSSIVVNADELHVGLNTTGGLETVTGLRVKLNGATLTSGAAGLSVTTPVDSTVARVATTAGTGSGTSYAFVHGLGKQYVTSAVYLISTGESVFCDSVATSTTTMTFNFATSQTLSQFQFTVTG